MNHDSNMSMHAELVVPWTLRGATISFRSVMFPHPTEKKRLEKGLASLVREFLRNWAYIYIYTT